jgi:electron transport complex protein RnfA
MDTVTVLLMGFISIMIVNNLVFTKFLGICPYLGVSGRIDMAFGMGCAVTFVVTLSGTLTWLIDHFILQPYNLQVMQYVCFILVIAGAVQLVEMYVRKFFPSLYDSFGIFLPLITTNCAILGLCLFINLWGIDNLPEAVVLSVGGGLGFTMAICIMAGIRENLVMADVPECLKGAPITLITAGILTLAFMGFAGMIR